jgi:hypothetical protein
MWKIKTNAYYESFSLSNLANILSEKPFISLVENLKVNNDHLQVHIDKDAHQFTRLI